MLSELNSYIAHNVLSDVVISPSLSSITKYYINYNGTKYVEYMKLQNLALKIIETDQVMKFVDAKVQYFVGGKFMKLQQCDCTLHNNDKKYFNDDIKNNESNNIYCELQTSFIDFINILCDNDRIVIITDGQIDMDDISRCINIFNSAKRVFEYVNIHFYNDNINENYQNHTCVLPFVNKTNGNILLNGEQLIDGLSNDKNILYNWLYKEYCLYFKHNYNQFSEVFQNLINCILNYDIDSKYENNSYFMKWSKEFYDNIKQLFHNLNSTGCIEYLRSELISFNYPKKIEIEDDLLKFYDKFKILCQSYEKERNDIELIYKRNNFLHPDYILFDKNNIFTRYKNNTTKINEILHNIILYTQLLKKIINSNDSNTNKNLLEYETGIANIFCTLL